MYFQVDSVDKVDTGKSVRKQTLANYCNTIYYLFFNQKQNYICIVFCQSLAMNFRFFQNLSTFVNVCQRMIFHGCV